MRVRSTVGWLALIVAISPALALAANGLGRMVRQWLTYEGLGRAGWDELAAAQPSDRAAEARHSSLTAARRRR
jgi:hypothetical protein